VSTLKERQRAAARARLEREMAERLTLAQQRRRKRLIGLSSGLAVLVVVALVVIIVNFASGGKKKTPVAAASHAPATCTWTPNPALKGTGGAAKNPDLVDTGTPPTSAPTNGSRDMVMDTGPGKITISLDLTKSPCAAASFTYLAGKKYFDNTTCHRLTTGGIYVLQCGDPKGTGRGGPGYTFAHEYLPTDQRPNYARGVVAMANPGDKDQNGSQFFILYKDTPEQADASTGQATSALASDYTVIGTVTGGMDVIDKIAAGGAKPADKAGNTAPKIPVNIAAITVGDVQAVQ
jgi:peptidyl-prolyl cis-trans isomerase B (cyclophilin B)